MINVADPTDPEALDASDFEATMYDRRKVHSPLVKDPSTGRMNRYTPRKRAWTKTRGVTLHQTACSMGERVERYDTIGAHFAVLRSGRVLRMANLNTVVYHGNGWNEQCVGIEVDGLYAGIEGDIHTVWDDPSTPVREQPMVATPDALRATRMLIRWIHAEVAAYGGELKVLCSHRQSSKDRRNDPGSAIWRAVALPLHAELGLSDGGPGFKLGDGYPNPEVWDPSRKGIKY